LVFTGICIAAAVGGGAAALANSLDTGAAVVAGLFSGSIALLAQFAWQYYADTRAKRQGLRSEWLAATTPFPLEREPEPDESALTLLDPHREVVRFNQTRVRNVRLLERWCETDSSAPVAVIAGPAGAGKTRLAIELCREMNTKGWVVGAARPGLGPAAIRGAMLLPERSLTIIDDADLRTDVPEILESVQRGSSQLRVIFVVEDWESWRDSLRRGPPVFSSGTLGAKGLTFEVRQLVADPPVVLLGPIASDATAQQQVFEQALRQFAWQREVEPPPTMINLESQQSAVLPLHAAALVAVLRAERGEATSSISPRHVAVELLKLEEEFWIARARANGLTGLRPTTLRTAVALAVLLGAEDEQDAIALLEHVPALKSVRLGLTHAVVLWLRDLYPSASEGGVDPRMPALLADGLLAQAFAQQPEPASMAILDASPLRKLRAITVLARALDSEPGLTDVLRAVVAANLDETITAASAAAVHGFDALDEILADVIRSPDIAFADIDRWSTLVPLGTYGLLRTGLALAQRVVERPGVEASPAQLTRYAGWLRRFGRSQEALDAARTAIQRSEATTDIPQLIDALNTASIVLTGLELHHEALAYLERAVRECRVLAETDPPGHQQDYGQLLANYGLALGRVNRPEEALASLRQAVTTMRAVVARNGSDTAGLGRTLDELGVQLSRAGRDRESIESLDEALEIFTELAATRPDLHRSDLASCLENRAIVLGRLGLDDEALAAAVAGTNILRQLATRARTIESSRNLATALNNLAARAIAANDVTTARKAGTEASAICRSTAPDGKADPMLAGVLANLTVTFRLIGDHDQAIAAGRRAVALFRQLSDTEPDENRISLATALTNLAAAISASGRPAPALQPAAEAVETYVGPTGSPSEADLPGYASALVNYGTILLQCGRVSAAVAATEKALEILVHLAQDNPAAFAHQLRVATRLLERAHAAG
jgi:tetratricopeptide (TPR) repeat protein